MPESHNPPFSADREPLPTHYVAPVEQNVVVDAVHVADKKSNLWRDAWRDMRRRPMFWVSVLIILVIVLVSLFPGLFTQADPRACTLADSNGGPSAGHPLGFNRQG